MRACGVFPGGRAHGRTGRRENRRVVRAMPIRSHERYFAFRGQRVAVMLVAASLMQGCSSAFTTGSAPESPVTEEYVRQFKAVDTAGKGVITLDQALAHYAQKFAELDRNKDGFLDDVEIAPMLPLMQATTGKDLVRALDNTGDGKVSPREFDIVANWLFARARGADGSMSFADTGRAQDRPRSNSEPKGPPPDAGMPDRGGPPSSRI